MTALDHQIHARLAEDSAAGVAAAQLYHCSMAEGYWLQRATDLEPRNPYTGKAMSKCGTRAEKVAS